MALLAVTPEIFGYFGQRTFVYDVYDKTCINGLQMSQPLTQQFEEACLNVLKDVPNVNRSLINFCELRLLNENPSTINNILMNVFFVHTEEFSGEITKNVTSNTFSVETFLMMYKKFQKQTFVLQKLLYNFDKCVKVDNNKNFSHINLMRSYIFYRNVVNKQYGNVNNKQYLWKLLINSITNNKLDTSKTISHINDVYKLIDYYKKLSFCATDKELLFNNELEHETDFSNLDSDGTLCDCFLNDINDMIINVCKKTITDKTNLSTLVHPIVSIIKTSEKIVDKLKFIVGYSQLLTTRLLARTSKYIVENELLKHISQKTDPELHAKMKICVVDINESDQFQNMFNNVNVSISSDKYAEFDSSSFDPKKCTINVLGQYGWNTQQINEYNVPIDVMPYVDVFKKCYQVYHLDRKLTVSPNTSTCVVDMTFGEKTYNINMTVAQMSVFYEVNKNGKMTANELSKKLNVPTLQTIGTVLNSLTMTKFLTRGEGELSNPDVPYTVNKSFTFLSDKVSIVGVYNKLLNPSAGKKNEPKRNDVKLNMLIVKALTEVPEMTIDEIAIKVSENDKATLDSVGVYTNEHIKFLVNKLVKDKYVTVDNVNEDGVDVKENTKYTYNNKNDVVSESDFDSELESDDEKIVVKSKLKPPPSVAMAAN